MLSLPAYRWAQIDRLELSVYPYLDESDQCLYYLERSKGTWEESLANSIVSNFQKDVERFADRPDVLRYKDEAIGFFANAVEAIIDHRERTCPLAIVPMVTSKPKSHRWYDDRLARTANAIAAARAGEVVVCDMLDIASEVTKAKAGGSRSPDSMLREPGGLAPEPPPGGNRVPHRRRDNHRRALRGVQEGDSPLLPQSPDRRGVPSATDQGFPSFISERKDPALHKAVKQRHGGAKLGRNHPHLENVTGWNASPARRSSYLAA